MKSTAYFVVILILILYSLFALNNFELPKFLLGDKGKVKGVIVNIDIQNVPKGGFIQIVKYGYCVDSIWYFDSKRIDRRYPYQYIGNLLSVEYLIKKPSRHKVNGYFKNNLGPIKKTKFICEGKIGFKEIELKNRLMFKREYQKQGSLTKELVGYYNYKSDSLIFKPFGQIKGDELSKIYQYKTDNMMFLDIKNDSIKKEYLIDLMSNERYEMKN